MSARRDHPAMPLILAMDVAVLKLGLGGSAVKLRNAVEAFDEDAAVDATPDWGRFVIAALPDIARHYLDSRAPISAEEYVRTRDAMFRVMSKAVGAALAVIGLTRAEMNFTREIARGEQLEFE